jgi:chromosome segregation ATPase
MSETRFLKKHNDVTFDNFNAVLKQNLLFQTKMALQEEDVKIITDSYEKKVGDYETIKLEVSKLIEEKTDLENKLNQKLSSIQSDLNNEKNKLLEEKTNLENNVKSKDEQISNLNNEKNRLQNEVNGQYQEKARLENDIRIKNEEISNLTNQKNNLESVLNTEKIKLEFKIKDLEEQLNTKNDYIIQLEKSIPNIKKKKTTSMMQSTDNILTDDVKLKVESSGGSF